jgi:hypothetical protein
VHTSEALPCCSVVCSCGVMLCVEVQFGLLLAVYSAESALLSKLCL